MKRYRELTLWGFAFVLTAYVLSYVVLVSPLVASQPNSTLPRNESDSYKIEGNWCHTVYKPLVALDHKVRPSVWNHTQGQ
jgi:hypothetical protein